MALFSPNSFHFDASPKFLDPDHHWRRAFKHPIAWQPKFDIRETADHFELSGELPGMKKEDINIEFVEPQTLHISGKVESSFTSGMEYEPKMHDEKHETSGDGEDDTKESEAKRHKAWLQERQTGEFSRVFNFPTRLDKDRLSATMDAGILRMLIPKSSNKETHRVPIN